MNNGSVVSILLGAACFLCFALPPMTLAQPVNEADSLNAWCSRANSLRRSGNFEEAEKEYLKITALNLQDSLATGRACFGLGFMAEYRSFQEARQYYLLALPVLEKYPKEAALLIQASSLNLSKCYAKLGDYQWAEFFAQKSLEVIRENFSTSNAYLVKERFKSYLELATSADLQGKVPQALAWYDSAFAFLKRQPDIPQYLQAILYSGYGTTRQKLGETELARANLKASLQIFIDLEIWFYVAETYRALGNLEMEAENPELAGGYYGKALGAWQEDSTLSPNSREVAKVFLRIGDLKHLQRRPREALEAYHQALIRVLPGVARKEVSWIPASAQLSSENVIIEALGGKARAWRALYDSTGDPLSLRHALACHERLADIRDRFLLSLDFSSSQEILARLSYAFVGEAVETTQKLYDVSKDPADLEFALNLAERYRAAVLRKAALQSQELEKPQSESMDLFVRDIQRIQTARENYLRSGDRFREAAMDRMLRERWGELYLTLIQTQPDEGATDSYVSSFLPASKWRKMLGSDEICILFQEGEEHFFVFGVTGDKLHLHSVLKDSLPVEVFFWQISSQDSFTMDQFQAYKKYVSRAYTLYERLVSPVLHAFPRPRRLLLITDGGLARVPFGALLSSLPQGGNVDYRVAYLDYLIEDYSITYDYSANLHFREKENWRSKGAGKSFAGFAPDFSLFASRQTEEKRPAQANPFRDCSTLSPIRYNLEETRTISEMFHERPFLRDSASKAAFLQEAAHSRILHLATHACVEDDFPLNSKIFFSDTTLAAYEVYALHLPAEMVVLSACETGAGPLQRGEGVMSLARGFSAAGCPSLVTSLWNVSDYAAADIMKSFYEHLFEDLDKPRSLQAAKLRYLSKAGKLDALPFFWASFVQTGDPAPLSFSRWEKWLVPGAVALSIVLAITWIWVRKGRGG